MPRKHDRTAILLEIILEFSSGARTARVSDLSMGGCFVDTIATVTVGETIGFKLRTDNEEWEDMSGEVAYNLPGFGFGLHFKDLSEKQTGLLAEMILANGGTV
jgi:hypothetical protein